MKTMIKSISLGILLSGALLVSVPAAASFFAEQPSSVFQSTSTMDGSGSAYSSNPSLDENGTASSPVASAPSGPRKAQMGLPSTPSTEGDSGNVPIGDAVLPLMLMAMAFAGGVYLRRRNAAQA